MIAVGMLGIGWWAFFGLHEWRHIRKVSKGLYPAKSYAAEERRTSYEIGEE